jgi:hypothetical protein
MNKSKKLINIIDTLESRAAKWLLAVDANCYNLKSALEKLGFKVLSYSPRLEDDELQPLLIKDKVDFFITKNGKHFIKYIESPTKPRTQYHLLWIDDSITAAIDKTAKAIEGAIVCDSVLGAKTGYVRINQNFVTNLPRIKKLSKIDKESSY